MTQDTTINPGENTESIQEELSTIEESIQEEPTTGWNWTQDDEIVRLRDALARSQADYQNLLMRVERDKADMAFYLSSKILTPLLTQVDTLERAVRLKDGVEGDSFIDGVRALHGNMIKFLESQGVRAFESIGSEVDPDKHDVMTEMSGEAGKIVQEFEKGYTLGDRVLRHAKVVVGNGN
jgi:molecular chaperone GrpE